MFETVLIPSDLFTPVTSFPACFQGAPSLGVQRAVLVHPLPKQALGGAASLLRGLALPPLEEQRKKLEALGLTVAVETPEGDPVQMILDTAYREKADLIAVSRFSPGLFQEFLVHPLADGLLHQARHPLLGLGCGGSEVPACRPLDQVFGGRILWATDFSRCAAAGFALLERIVARTGAEAVLFHVQERGRLLPHVEARLSEFDRTDRERLEALAERLRSAGSRAVTCEVELGRAGPTIVEKARSFFATLVVLGTQGRDWTEELLVGSVAHHVARHAPSPVLLVPGRGDAA